MKAQLARMTFNIELQSGEKLTFPPEMIASVGEGRWTITVQPADDSEQLIRNHSAFLSSYSPEDEGLYEDCHLR